MQRKRQNTLRNVSFISSIDCFKHIIFSTHIMSQIRSSNNPIRHNDIAISLAASSQQSVSMGTPSPLLLFKFCYRETKNCPHGYEPLVVGTGYLWRFPGLRFPPARLVNSHKPNKSTISGKMINTKLKPYPCSLLTRACGG